MFIAGGNAAKSLAPKNTPIVSMIKLTITEIPIAMVDIMEPSLLPSYTPAAFWATAEQGIRKLEIFPAKNDI